MVTKSFIILACLMLTQGLPMPTGNTARRDNIDERGPYFQGDIVLPPGIGPHGGAGVIGEHLRWPNGTVVYAISDEFTEAERSTILQAMDEIARDTCISFRQREQEIAYVFIQRGGPDSGCWSLLGRLGIAAQLLNLEQPGCVTKGIVMHELLHTIGFYHEQSRSDRNDYVHINWSNIQPGTEGNFGLAISNLYNLTYDYGSIMHYSRYAFAVDPNIPTIDPVDPEAEIGQRRALSSNDIAAVQAMYCPEEI